MITRRDMLKRFGGFLGLGLFSVSPIGNWELAKEFVDGVMLDPTQGHADNLPGTTLPQAKSWGHLPVQQQIKLQSFWPWLGKFALNVGAGVVTDLVSDWIGNFLSPEESQTVVNVNNYLEQQGFTDFNTPVYSNGPTFFYEVGHQNQYNAAAPFFVRTHQGLIPIAQNQYPIIMGPNTMGLTYASENWNNPYISAAEGLFPLNFNYVPAWFDRPSDLYISRTLAGQTQILYVPYPEYRAGLIKVGAWHNNGDLLFGRDYPIYY